MIPASVPPGTEPPPRPTNVTATGFAADPVIGAPVPPDGSVPGPPLPQFRTHPPGMVTGGVGVAGGDGRQMFKTGTHVGRGVAVGGDGVVGVGVGRQMFNTQTGGVGVGVGLGVGEIRHVGNGEHTGGGVGTDVAGGLDDGGGGSVGKGGRVMTGVGGRVITGVGEGTPGARRGSGPVRALRKHRSRKQCSRRRLGLFQCWTRQRRPPPPVHPSPSEASQACRVASCKRMISVA